MPGAPGEAYGGWPFTNGRVSFHRNPHLRGMNGLPVAERLKRLPLLAGAGLVLLALLAQLSVGPLHLFERFSIREEMKHRLMTGLPKSELSVFHFSQADLEDIDFEDEGREMEVGGMMYDIVRTCATVDGGIVIEAVRDNAETKLMADLDRVVQGHLAADTKGQEQRSRIVAAWANYHEVIGRSSLRPPSSNELGFARFRGHMGRTTGAIDPGPPRLA